MPGWLIAIVIVLLVMAPVGLALGGSAALSRWFAAGGSVGERRAERLNTVVLWMVPIPALAVFAVLFVLSGPPRLGVVAAIVGWMVLMGSGVHLAAHWMRWFPAWARLSVMAVSVAGLLYAGWPLFRSGVEVFEQGAAGQRGNELALGCILGSIANSLVSHIISRRRTAESSMREAADAEI